MAGIDHRSLAKSTPNGVRAVDGLDLQIADGEFFALLGPSGCGKTTLLRTIAGLEAATEGTVRIGDARRHPDRTGQARRGDGLPGLRALPAHERGGEHRLPAEGTTGRHGYSYAAAERTAGALSLQGLLERKPGQLSGGQQQRVALARAIASQAQGAACSTSRCPTWTPGCGWRRARS